MPAEPLKFFTGLVALIFKLAVSAKVIATSFERPAPVQAAVAEHAAVQ